MLTDKKFKCNLNKKIIERLFKMKKKIKESDRLRLEGVLQNESRFIVSRNIKKYRKKCKMTQAELAQKIGKTVEMVCQIENNVAGTKLATLDAIADVLGVDTYMLFLNADRPNLENISSELLEILFLIEDESPEFVERLKQFLNVCVNKNIDK